MKDLLVSWKTTVTGGLIALCGSTAYLDILPEKYSKLLMLTCAMLTAFGFLVSKDKDVSHSPVPEAPQVVSAVNEAKPNTANE